MRIKECSYCMILVQRTHVENMHIGCYMRDTEIAALALPIELMAMQRYVPTCRSSSRANCNCDLCIRTMSPALSSTRAACSAPENELKIILRSNSSLIEYIRSVTEILCCVSYLASSKLFARWPIGTAK